MEVVSKVQRGHFNSIGQKVMTFLNDENSKNTTETYQSHIEQFFLYMRGKELSQLAESDLYFEHEQIVDYKADLLAGRVPTYLKRNDRTKVKYVECAESTVNSKLSALRSLYDFLSISNKKIDPRVFKVKRVRQNEVDINSSGYLSVPEALEMIELARREYDDNNERSLMMEIAVFTSIRLDALHNLNINGRQKGKERCSWIVRENNEWIVYAIDKRGKLDKKPIDDELYDKIMEFAKEDGSLWCLSQRTFQRTVEQLAEKMGLTERHVTFHSLKAVAINWLLEQGLVVEATIQGNHNDMNTMWKSYANKVRNYSTMAGKQMRQQKDLSVLEGLSAEQLIEVIKQCGLSTQLEILGKVNSI